MEHLRPQGLRVEDVAGRIDPATHAALAGRDASLAVKASIPPLTANRFDLAFKLMYLGDGQETRSAFAADAYAAHIRAFSLGRFEEPGDPGKTSLDDYLRSFAELVDALRAHGFDAGRSLVPLASDGSILNGAHRTACAIHLQTPVTTLATGLPPARYDFRYFRDRGVDEVFLDAAALAFMDHAEGCHLALVWPSAEGRDDEIEAILGDVAYRKPVALTSNGAHNLLAEVYSGESWLGPRDENYPGVRGKQVGCFARRGPVRAIVFQAQDIDEVRRRKEAVRSLFGLGKDALHITDTREEALRVARLLFNRNGVHFLNFARPNRFTSTAEDLARFSAFLDHHAVPRTSVAIDGGTVLAVYGLRPSNDVDYLGGPFSTDSRFENHEDYLPYHDLPLSELLDDPRNHFIYGGLKFLSLAQVAAMKRARGERKDRDDLALAGPIMGGIQRQTTIAAARASLRFHASRVRSKAVAAIKPRGAWLARRLGVYSEARSAYKWLRAKLR